MLISNRFASRLEIAEQGTGFTTVPVWHRVLPFAPREPIDPIKTHSQPGGVLNPPPTLNMARKWTLVNGTGVLEVGRWRFEEWPGQSAAGSGGAEVQCFQVAASW